MDVKKRFDLGELEWTLSGYTPNVWARDVSMELQVHAAPEFWPVPARVPGSVQQALRDAGTLPDWNVEMNSLACEWVENRHWVYHTTLPDDWFATGGTPRLPGRGGSPEVSGPRQQAAQSPLRGEPLPEGGRGLRPGPSHVGP